MEDGMSREQRIALDEQLRSTPPGATVRPVEQMRTEFAALMAHFPAPAGTERAATRLGGRPAIRITPLEHARPGTILYFHGGSFSLGSPDTAIGLTTHLVLRTGIPAISLDYRLAPEHPFPSAVLDGVAAYRDLLERGVEPGTIVFAGDSAGGSLSVTVALAARDAGLPTPAAIVAFSPMFDATRSGRSMRTKDGIDPFFAPQAFAHTGALLLDGQDPAHPLLSPALVGDLTGLPPVLLQVGTNELLLDDSMRFAARAVDAEVDVILDVVAGVPHVFPAFVGGLDEAGEALDRAALFLSQHLRTEDPDA
jgi:epsilon-lactone hydrolase